MQEILLQKPISKNQKSVPKKNPAKTNISTVVSSPHPVEIISPTINNYLHITAVGTPNVSNFVTIPTVIQKAYFGNPVIQNTPTTNSKRNSSKISGVDNKRPAKNPAKSQQHSMNSSIREFLNDKKTPRFDIGKLDVKVKNPVM